HVALTSFTASSFRYSRSRTRSCTMAKGINNSSTSTATNMARMVIDRRSQPTRSVRGVGGSGVLEMLEGKSFDAPGMVVALSGNRETRQHQKEVCLPVRWTDFFPQDGNG